MFSHLKNHPFAVSAFFESTTVLTFTFSKEVLESHIPPCLQLDTFQNKWAFVAIAMVQTKHLRPKGFPKFLGNNFFLIGYRVFVRYTTETGKNLRGLYILQSQTNKKKMEISGNIFTHYNYTTIDISQLQIGIQKTISSKKSDFEVSYEKKEKITLPSTSSFSSWKEARRFSGPLPFTFTYKESTQEVLIIEGVRQDWKPQPIQVNSYHFSFFKQRGLPNPQLASAFTIENIPYYWKKGRKEQWKA